MEPNDEKKTTPKESLEVRKDSDEPKPDSDNIFRFDTGPGFDVGVFGSEE